MFSRLVRCQPRHAAGTACHTLLGCLLFLTGCLLPLTSHAEAGQEADWAARRAQSQVLGEQAAALREEADRNFALEDSRCYEQTLTNRCREQARYTKVLAYQKARRLDIEARQIELAVRREEKAQKEADFIASTPEREQKARQRIEAIERQNQEHLEAIEKRRERKREQHNEP